MALAERGAKNRYTVANAMLMSHEDVGVAFHDDRSGFTFEMGVGGIKGIKFSVFGE